MEASDATTHCRSCRSSWLEPVLDLGRRAIPRPLARDDAVAESRPLRWLHCGVCGLVQAECWPSLSPAAVVDTELVDRWLADRPGSRVVAPTGCTADAYRAGGAEVVEWGSPGASPEGWAWDGFEADLVHIGDVAAADVDAMAAGIREVLHPRGVAILETTPLSAFVRRASHRLPPADQPYMFSLHALQWLLSRHDLRVSMVERPDRHRLRAFVQAGHGPETPAVGRWREEEATAQLHLRDGLVELQLGAEHLRRSVTTAVSAARQWGDDVAAIGATAEGLLLLDYCGFEPVDVSFIVDDRAAGRWSPGGSIPVVGSDVWRARTPEGALVFDRELAQRLLPPAGPVRVRQLYSSSGGSSASGDAVGEEDTIDLVHDAARGAGGPEHLADLLVRILEAETRSVDVDAESLPADRLHLAETGEAVPGSVAWEQVGAEDERDLGRS
jgi:hypothetical protein